VRTQNGLRGHVIALAFIARFGIIVGIYRSLCHYCWHSSLALALLLAFIARFGIIVGIHRSL